MDKPNAPPPYTAQYAPNFPGGNADVYPPLPSNPGYPQGNYPPAPPGAPPSGGGYPYPSGGYQPGGGYPQPGGGYPQPGGGYPQPGGAYPQPGGGYAPNYPHPPPQQQLYPSGGYVPPGFVPSPHGPGGPIVQQPGAGQPPGAGGWMNIPQGLTNCPPGLEYLSMIDQLLVHQKVELLEALVGFETNNKFTIKNSIGQKVYYAVEDTDCCTRLCCGPYRPFDMKILDNYSSQVIHMHRPLACESCCFPCCLQTMEVSSPPGTLIGTVEQEWTICAPCFVIKNSVGESVLRIEGPICRFGLCGDIEFKVLGMNGEKVGKISKQWSGLLREMFTDADYFGITFPMDLDVRMKAVLLGALFLIDAMFFEKSGNQETDGVGMF